MTIVTDSEMANAAPPHPIAARLEAVRSEIAAAAAKAGRASHEIELLAVSKFHSVDDIAAAIAAGQSMFGESRVQEAMEKFPALRAAHPQLSLHLIGSLQTNKAEAALALFDCIQTLDRPKLAEKLATLEQSSGRRISYLIEVNTGEEPQKAGIQPREADAFIPYCQNLGLNIAGLMCIPPEHEPAALHFALLANIASRHRLDTLSMGMSGDFMTAIRFGATMVRVGTAIFGARPAAQT